MVQDEEVRRTASALEWPTWASWTIAAVVLGSIVTVAATINDIW